MEVKCGYPLKIAVINKYKTYLEYHQLTCMHCASESRLYGNVIQTPVTARYICRLIQSKKDGKDQESIQSSTTPDPGCHMGK